MNNARNNARLAHIRLIHAGILVKHWSVSTITIDTDNVYQVSRAAHILGNQGYSFYRSGAGETVFAMEG